MKVLALNWRDSRHPEAGGAEVHLYEILSRWVKRGAEVTVVASGFPGAAPEDQQDGMRILRRGGTKADPNTEGCFQPTWSPDGTKIAFGRSDEIYTVNADGTGLRQVTDAPGSESPEWGTHPLAP